MLQALDHVGKAIDTQNIRLNRSLLHLSSAIYLLVCICVPYAPQPRWHMNSILQPTHKSTPHSARPQLHELGLNIKKQTNEQKTNTGHANVQQTGEGER